MHSENSSKKNLKLTGLHASLARVLALIHSFTSISSCKHLLVIRRFIFLLEDGRYNKATIKKATRASIPGKTENAPLRYWAQGSPQGLEKNSSAKNDISK